jgi:hypothetical protein
MADLIEIAGFIGESSWDSVGLLNYKTLPYALEEAFGCHDSIFLSTKRIGPGTKTAYLTVGRSH